MFQLISIVIPVYNAEKNLEKVLQSIVQQKKFEESEIVLIDDGSTDDSYKICKSYAQKYRNIKVKHVNNSGVSQARNIGKSIAQGEYIWFVDADDYISDGAFERLYEIVAEKRYDIVFFNNFFEQVDGTIISKSMKNMKEEVEYFQYEIQTVIIPWILGYTENQSAVFKLAKQKGMVTHLDCYNAPWQALYRHEFIERISFDKKLRIYEDLLFNFEALLSATSIYYIEDSLYHYVAHTNGLATKYHYNYAEMKLYLYHKMIKIMSDFGISDEIKQLIGYRIRNDLVSIFVNECKNMKGDAIQILKKFFNEPIVQKALLLKRDEKLSYRILLWLIKNKCYATALKIVSIRIGGTK